MKTVLTIGTFAVIAALVAAVMRLVIVHNIEQTKVLVVHSYNTDLAWVNDIDEGISQAKKDYNSKHRINLNLRTHYMNLRNHPDCNFYQNAASDVRFTIDDWKPEVVIIVDDLAQALVGFNQLHFDKPAARGELADDLNIWLAGSRCDVPGIDYFDLDNPATERFVELVFAGVNGSVDPYGYPLADNVSGIYERKNYTALIETLQTLRAAYDRPVRGLRMLNDDSATGRTESEGFRQQDWGDFNALPPINARTLDEWQTAVLQANDDDVMLLIANYENLLDANGKKVAPETLIQWTERMAKLPVLGANTRFVADGGMMTVAISGSEQGEVAMNLAFAVLAGDRTRPQVDAKQFLIGMNQSLIRKRNMETLPAIYEAFGRKNGNFVDAVNPIYAEKGGTNP